MNLKFSCILQVFDKAFTKFARWSTKTPVPHIGHIDTPYSDVEHFYDFWGRFQSWRDPLEMLAKDEEELHVLFYFVIKLLIN